MENNPRIGIVGNGFVGQAIANAFVLTTSVKIYDKDLRKSVNSLEQTIQDSDVIFMCLPTPMNISDKNKIDLSIIESCFREIIDLKTDLSKKVFVIKSTVVPGTTKAMKQKFEKTRIVFNPEFLTERSANLDFINATRIVLGGDAEDCQLVADLYKSRFPYKKIIKTDSQTAEFVKYVCNCFFATKVSFMNEMFQLSDKLNLDWSAVLEGFITDGRVGNSHLDVPGHDGLKGFGGKCFPKDVNAMINFYLENNLNPTILSAAWQKNLEVRETKDWEQIDGATSRKEKKEK